MMRRRVRSGTHSAWGRCARAFRDPISLFVGVGLVSILALLLLTARETRARTPRLEGEPPALVSMTHTNAPPRYHRYPRGQLQADLHTLVNMMRLVLTPEPPDLVGAMDLAV